jgi:hypothetical protein
MIQEGKGIHGWDEEDPLSYAQARAKLDGDGLHPGPVGFRDVPHFAKVHPPLSSTPPNQKLVPIDPDVLQLAGPPEQEGA